MPKKKNKNKIGLALGTGSARGWAHIGVIKALNEANIKVDYVAGVSIGAVVGAVYAAGNINALEDVALQLNWKQILSFIDIVFPKSGLIDGNKIADFIRMYIKAKNIEDLPLPFCAVSTDLATGKEIIIKKGDIVEAVRASISTPGIFTPVIKDNMTLIDGGIVNSVPVSVVRKMGADIVIAVDLTHDIISNRGIGKIQTVSPESMQMVETSDSRPIKKQTFLTSLNTKIRSIDMSALTHIKQWMKINTLPNIFEILLGSLYIMEAQITSIQLQSDPPDLLIQPKLGHLRYLEFHRAQEAILEGYEATKSSLKNLYRCDHKS
ncbi:MAG: patatin-like phospholipase family protein [Desulfobacterales bacterium]|nr:patatin-like phospholipase family protein [Desulfobacterales bacterium]